MGDVASESAAVMRAALAVDPSRVKQVDFRPHYAAFLRDLIIKV